MERGYQLQIDRASFLAGHRTDVRNGVLVSGADGHHSGIRALNVTTCSSAAWSRMTSDGGGRSLDGHRGARVDRTARELSYRPNIPARRSSTRPPASRPWRASSS